MVRTTALPSAHNIVSPAPSVHSSRQAIDACSSTTVINLSANRSSSPDGLL